MSNWRKEPPVFLMLKVMSDGIFGKPVDSPTEPRPDWRDEMKRAQRENQFVPEPATLVVNDNWFAEKTGMPLPKSPEELREASRQRLAALARKEHGLAAS